MRECGKIWYSRTGFPRRIPKATDTHSEYVILIVFHLNDGYTNAPKCYVIRTLPVFLCLKLFSCVLLFRAVSTYITGICHAEFNPLNPELNPICYLLALLGAHHFLHVSRIRVKLLTFRLLMSYIYMEHPFLMFLDHTQRRSTVGRTPLDE